MRVRGESEYVECSAAPPTVIEGYCAERSRSGEVARRIRSARSSPDHRSRGDCEKSNPARALPLLRLPPARPTSSVEPAANGCELDRTAPVIWPELVTSELTPIDWNMAPYMIRESPEPSRKKEIRGAIR